MSDPTIVQAEMFTKNGKVVVRFHDYTGELTALAEKYQHYNKRESQLCKLVTDSKGIVQWWYGKKHRRLSHKLHKIKDQGSLLLEKYLADIAVDRHTLAMQMKDFSFREMYFDQVHQEGIKIYSWLDYWLFVFAPNDLCADKNIGVATIM